ncbi:secreted protein [Melampsora americana]|nr:secreted protein [Melampsora americana]
MRFSIALEFVLLAACLARPQGQEALNARGAIQARSDAAPITPAASTDTPAKPTSGPAGSQSLIKDPKLCAIIVKRMKDFEAMGKNGGVPKTGATTTSSATTTASSPAASAGAPRRSKRNDIGSLNRRDGTASKDGSPASTSSTAVDPNACKEMETMIQARRDKLLADIKKGMEALTTKKDASATASTDATSKTPPADPGSKTPPAEAAPKTGAADATPKTGAADATPKTGAADATPKTGSTNTSGA